MTEGRGANVNATHREAIRRDSIWERRWNREGQAALGIQRGLGLIQQKIVALQSVTEVIKCRRDAMAMGWGNNKAYVINDSGADEARIANSMQLEDACKCAYEQE
jgi:hypothetical protein